MCIGWLNLATDIKLLLLLGTANTMPIVAYHLFKERFSTPVDFGREFFDKRPIFGPHKTWRGIAASIIGAWIVSIVLNVHQFNGILLAFWSMIGDMTASFIKRRRGLESGAKCTGIDQAIESALPLVVLKGRFGLTWLDCFFITLLFVVFEIVFSPFFYKIGFRKNPY